MQGFFFVYSLFKERHIRKSNQLLENKWGQDECPWQVKLPKNALKFIDIRRIVDCFL